VTVLRLLATAAIVLPILMLCVGGEIAWQQKRQDASDETIRIIGLVYESTAKLFGAQLLAIEQTHLAGGRQSRRGSDHHRDHRGPRL
jgi:hypothetical protein